MIKNRKRQYRIFEIINNFERHLSKFYPGIFLFIFLISTLYAEIHIGGQAETTNRYWVSADSGKWTWNEVRADINLEATPGDNLHFYSEMRLRAFGFPEITSISDLQRREKDRNFPWSLLVRETYLDIYGFIHPNIDLRIGKQIIAWGTADKINPTSNLSPYDLEDFFEFGEKIGVNALRVNFTLEPVTLEADFIPVFTPSTLPPPEWTNIMLGEGISLPAGMHLVNKSDTVKLPERKLNKSAEAAFKISGTLWDWDFSLSYFYGYDGLPLGEKVEIIPIDTLGNINLDIISSYPRIQLIGGDFAGSVKGIGVWGEGAFYIPEDFIMTSIIHSPYGPLMRTDTLLENKNPYFKFVLGADYTFKNGMYLNIQYVRGFLHERGDSLKDYFIARVEKKFFNDELKIVPLGIAATISDWDNPQENYGVAYLPEISYSPYDNVEVRLGGYFLEGKGSNIFSNMKKRDEVFLRVKLSF
ncbi:MAG TPA: hypothetical protein ENL41_01845 [candidate division WOR-3 bacterium]|uniref:Alginate export domain-containing protein n=1 Tax=candidate division WOR-3 bacterium TaxID=2052148 RepID=A0A7C5I4K3_UNCW3|nr:hypothetical protein [candidate division WOR-3 bacterium]